MKTDNIRMKTNEKVRVIEQSNNRMVGYSSHSPIEPPHCYELTQNASGMLHFICLFRYIVLTLQRNLNTTNTITK